LPRGDKLLGVESEAGAAGAASDRKAAERPEAAAETPAPELGPEESLTSGGYVLEADGTVLVSREAELLVDAIYAVGDFEGLTMAEVTERIGSCDPIPADEYVDGHLRSWSQPGYTVGILFDRDDRAVGILEGSEDVGGPPTPGLRARQAQDDYAGAVVARIRDLARAGAWLGGSLGLVVGGLAGAYLGETDDTGAVSGLTVLSSVGLCVAVGAVAGLVASAITIAWRR
jgi:hypothetical protein